MSALVAPILQGTTLPVPSAFSFRRELRHVATEMASGAVVYDFLDSDPKRIWTLEWRGLTSLETADIFAAFESLLTNALSDNFTDPKNQTYTVGVGTNTKIPEATYVAGTGWMSEPLYNMSIELREV